MVDDLLVRVDAQVTQFNAAFGSATKSTIQLEAALKRASAQQELYQRQIAKYGAQSAQAQSALARAQMSNARLAEQQAAIQAKAAAEQKAAIEAQAAAYTRAGRTFVTAGGAIALGLGLSAKAAIDWQQAFTRVRQALDGSPEQIAQVESGLRDLATTLPVTHDQLAEIARDASQLGVATQDVVGFTKVVGELSVTAPDLQDGATALARFLNVTGTSQAQVENVASTMTKLGQAGASTVSEIADLGLRLAGAGRTASLTDGEILGLANSMTSLGLRVETAGTNFSKTLLTINTAVGAGGDDLRKFAAIAGESADQFAKDYRDNAANAIVTFLEGLDRIRKSGGDVASTLAGLGITSQRQVDVLNRLSQNTDLVTQSIEDGNQAFSDNTALQETFAKQAETTASRMQVASNNVHDLAISLGEELLPALGDAAGMLTQVGSALGSLPGPAKSLVVILGTATAATLLFSGASLLMRARLLQSQLALEAAGASTTAYSRKAIAARAGLLALGIAVQQLGSDLAGSNETAKSFVNVLSTGLIAGAVTANPWIGLGAAVAATFAEAAKSGGNLDEVMGRMRATLGGVVDTLDKTTGAVTGATTAWLQHSLATSGAYDAAQQLGVSLDDVTQAALGNADALARVNATIDAAPDAFGDLFGKPLLAAIEGSTNAITGQAKAIRDQYAAQADAAGVTRSAASIQGDFASAVHGTSDALQGQKSDVEATTAAMRGYNSVAASIISRQLGLAQTILDAKKAAKSQEDGFRKNTAAGQLNWQQLLALAAAADGFKASTDQGAAAIERARRHLVDFATAQGMTQSEAEKTATKLLGVADAADKVTHTPAHVKVDEHGADEAKGKIDAVRAALSLVDGMTASATVTIQAILRTATGQQAAAAARGNWTGGYTGPGGKYDPAGIVHKGEFVFDKDSTSRIGPANLMSMMQAARGYASGGYATGGHAAGGGGGILTLAELLKIIARPDAVATLARVNALYREREKQERALQPLLKAQRAAQREVNQLAHDDTATKKEQAQAAKDLQKAEKAVTDQRSDLKDATDKWRQAQQDLVAEMRASVAQTLSLSSAFGGEGTSLSAQGLLAKKRAGAQDTKEFVRDLRIIKRKGADKDLIAELRAEGPTQDALTLLRDLIRQPRSYFRAEARADAADRSSARQLAVFGTHGGGARIGTQIQRQAVVHMHGVHLGPTLRQIEKAARKGAEHGLLLAGAP